LPYWLALKLAHNLDVNVLISNVGMIEEYAT
jgi:hypothetical protein